MFHLIPTAYAQIHAPNPLFVDPALSQNFDFEILLTEVINFFIGFVGVVALLMLVIGGYYLLSSGGNEESVTKGRKAVSYAIIGIVVIIISYAAVFTVTTSLSDLGDGRVLPPGLGGILPAFPAPGSIIDLFKIINPF